MKFAAILIALAMSLPAQAQERAVIKKAVVAAPIDAVWQSWTTTAGVKEFFAPDANVEARVNGPFEIYFNPYAAPGMKGADDMKVLALQDRKMISFTWNAPPHLPDVRGQRTYVTVRMKPLGEKETEVTLYHGGWGDGGQWDQAYAYFDRAWGNVLVNLQQRHAEGKPRDWTEWLGQLRKMMEGEAKKKG